MGLPISPPTSSTYSVRKGQTGWYVFGIQATLNDCGPYALAEDGIFGPGTETAVKAFQKKSALFDDGIAGPVTQSKLVSMCLTKIENANTKLPRGMLRGFALLESGMLISVVNTAVTGGIDCGPVQLRIYSPYDAGDQPALKQAFSACPALDEAAMRFVTARDSFLGKDWVGQDHQKAGLCAALSHNWPAGADQQARYGHVSSPNSLASWVSAGTRFPDGTPVKTRQQWAEFYALGGEHGPGQTTQFVTDWR